MDRVIGGEIHSFSTLSSTNDLGKEWAEAGKPEGLVIVADEQTQGRGRFGRQWSSPKGLGAYFSVLLRPKLQLQEYGQLSLLAGASIVEALDRRFKAQTQVRWPNDIVCQERKLAGVLTEIVNSDRGSQAAVVGIGINVNHGPDDFLPSIKDRATSLRVLLGRELSPREVIEAVLARMDAWYRLLHREGSDSMRSAWEAHSSLKRGTAVSVRCGEEEIEGTVLGLTPEGYLHLRSWTGTECVVSSGEVNVLRTIQESSH